MKKFCKGFIQEKAWKQGCLFGFFYSFLSLLGGRIYKGNLWGHFFSLRDFGNTGIVFLAKGVLYSLLFALLYQLCNCASERAAEEKQKKEPAFPVIYLGLLLCYIPCYLAYFPGIMSYDSWYITLQALRIINFDNHHSFLHTLIWSLFAKTDELFGVNQIGIVLYTALQLLIMTAIYAYACQWFMRRQIGKAAKAAAFIFYACNPVFHIFTLILTKDVFFSGCFLLFTLQMIDFLEKEPGERSKAERGKIQWGMVGTVLLCCLFRNNMIYVLLVFTAILLFAFRKRANACRNLIAAVIIFYFVTKIVYPSLGVAEGSRKEMLSVPMSQIAAVYQKEEKNLTEDEKTLILRYIPNVESYDRFFADRIKGNFRTEEYTENPTQFFSLWLRLFRMYPGEYIEAFLSLNLPCWYLPMESVREYIETDNYSQDYPVVRANFLPEIYRRYEEISENNASWMKLPGIRLIYALGTPIWVLLFCLIQLAGSGRKKRMLALLPGVLLWMTFLLGPVSAFRYMEPLMLICPIGFVLCLEKDDYEKSNI